MSLGSLLKLWFVGVYHYNLWMAGFYAMGFVLRLLICEIHLVLCWLTGLLLYSMSPWIDEICPVV